MAFKLTNTSLYQGKRGDTNWWKWEVHLESFVPKDLEKIKYVEYHLHPTFSNPIRRVYDETSGFKLKASGWGTFEILAKVVFKNEKQEPLILKHWLKFDFEGRKIG
jgi:transcription initiation factor IIF auxiliary subunit